MIAGGIGCFYRYLPVLQVNQPAVGELSMLRRIPVIAACVAALAFSAGPAAASTSHVHAFSIPGVYGVRAWGTYATGTGVRVTVCVEVTARSVYGAAAVGLTFDSGYLHHDNVSAVTIGDGHAQCHRMS